MTPERRAMIETLRTFPERFAALVAPLTDAQLDARPLPGEWTVREIVHHVADSHMSGNMRFRLPITEQRAPLRTYDQDAWAKLADYALPLEPSLLILRGLHARWVALLEALDDAQWAMTGVHPAWGERPLDYIVGVYAAHGEEHIAQITRTLAAQG